MQFTHSFNPILFNTHPSNMTLHNPHPAYDSQVVYGDKELYARLGKIAEESNEKTKTLVENFDIPIRSGKAWVVKKGMLFLRQVQFRQVQCSLSMLGWFVSSWH
jgi:hypothetical protein